MMSNIALIGLMGCGKTTVGKRLAYVLRYKFIDIDEAIEEHEGMSISEIFHRCGESYFRELERWTLKKVVGSLNMHDYVISTGGGIVLNETNMSILRKNAKIVYLKTPAERLCENLRDDRSRPLLNTPNRLETISALLAEREPLYEKYADVIVSIGDEEASVATAADKIAKTLGGKYNDFCKRV